MSVYRGAQRNNHVGGAFAVLVALLAGAVGCSSGAGGEGGGAKACAVDADCAALEDGDACNGSLRCVAASGTCAVDPATVVVCDTSADGACSASRCIAATGACELVHSPAGSACDDGEACTVNDRCEGGACVAGDEICACRVTADCEDDGNLCNGTPFCNTKAFPHRCELNPATVVSCPSSEDPCVSSLCVAKTGTCADVAKVDGAACDDGDNCTSDDACSKGACVGGTDTCSCAKDSDCVDTDGDLCTGTPFCDKTSGKGVCVTNPATVVVCATDADTACAQSACNPQNGACSLLPVADKTPCDDGETCTVGDFCVAGSCFGGKDTCACTSDADCKDNDDGDLCNGTPFCNLASGKCLTNPATIVHCKTVDDSACAKHVCQPKTGTCELLPREAVKLLGCQAVELGGGVVAQFCSFAPKQDGEAGDSGPFACEDGDACTEGDVCKGASCAAGTKVCECSVDADCEAQDDGDLCNGTLYCDKQLGTCKANAASVVFCPKGADTTCLKNTCAPKTGLCTMQPVTAGTPCDDGEPCTSATACEGGECAGGKATGCDDGDACTVDACAKGKGCTHTAKNCDDGNACTDSSCDAKLGTCKVAPLAKGQACNADSDGCTVGDSCDGAGTCEAGAKAVCAGKPGPCQQDACQSKGVDGFSCAVVAQPDGAACADGDSCFTGAVCKAGACQAGDVSTLWSAAPKVGGAMAFEAGTFTSGALEGALSAAASDGHGGVVLAGVVTSGADAGRWRVIALGRDGKEAWQRLVQPPSGISKLAEVRAVLDRGPLGVVVVGRGVRADASLAAVSAHLGVDGKGPAAVHHGAADKLTFRLDVAALHPTGNIVMLGAKAKGNLDGIVTMRTPTGEEVWLQSPTVGWLRGRKISIFPGGKTVIAAETGVHPSGLGAMGYFYGGYDATGNELWYLGQGFGGALVEITAMGLTDEGLLRSFVQISNLKGEVLQARWFSADTQTGGVVGLDLGVDPKGALPAVSACVGASIVWASEPDAKGVVLALADRFGNTVWQRKVPASFSAIAGVAAAADHERLLLFGATGSGASLAPAVKVVDRWGFGACNERGVCAAKAWADCDDANDCTADACDASFGCTHTPKVANLCDPLIACTSEGRCTTGKCVAHSYGRTFVTLHTADPQTPAGLSRGEEGSAIIWNHFNGSAPAGNYVAVGNVSLKDGQISAIGEVYTPNLIPPAVATHSVAKGYVLAGAFTDGGRASTRVMTLGEDLLAGGPTVDVADTVCKSCSLTPAAVVGAINGDFVVGANSGRDGGTAFIIRVNTAAKLVWKREHGSASKPAGVAGLAGLADGGVAWVGQTIVGGAVVPALDRVDDKNGGFVELVDTDSPNGWFSAVDEDPEGGLVCAGAIPTGSSWSSLLVSYTPAGKVAWRSVPKLADGVLYETVMALDDGGLFTSGTRKEGAGFSLLAERRNAAGAALWTRQHRYLGQADMAATRRGVFRAKDGGWVFGAQAGVKGGVHDGIVRTDASGHIACDDAGGCAKTATDACDDDNACTVDWCDAKSGCAHLPLSGVACPGGTCSAGTCK